MTAEALRRCPTCGTRVPARLQAPCPGCGEVLKGPAETQRSPARISTPQRSPAVREPRAVGRVRTRRSVLIRDLLIFELKLFLDGLGDLVFSQLAILALVWDLIRGGPEMGKTFYTVLRFGERWDLWLNLYRPSQDTSETGEGLLGAGMVDANSLLGRIEEMVREKGIRDPAKPDQERPEAGP